MELKLHAPSWDELYWLTIRLAEAIERSGFKPDAIVAIARGGWIIGRLLSDFLDNPNVANMKIEYYMDVAKTKEHPVITQPISIDVVGKDVLLADDVADSGKSLKIAKEHLNSLGAKDVRAATVYYKPWSILKPDYYIVETDSWIIFPHEVFEAVKSLANRWLRDGKPFNIIRKSFIDAGLSPKLVDYFLQRVLGPERR